MKNLTYLLGLVCVILGFSTVYFYSEKNEMQRAVKTQYAQQLAIASEEMSTLNSALLQSSIISDEQALNEQLLAIHEASGKVKNALSAIPILKQQSSDWIHYMTEIEALAGHTIREGSYESWQEQSVKLTEQMQEVDEEWTVLTAAFFQHGSTIDDFMKETTDFDAISTKLKTFNEESFPVTASESDYEKKKTLQEVKDKPITKQQAIEKFHSMYPNLKDATLTVSFNEDDAPYEFYHLQFIRGSKIGYVDLLKNGGHLLSVLIDRPVSEVTISQQDAKERATEFLQRNAMKDTEFVEVRENHEAYHFVFARKSDDVIIYPDSIQLKIAKDDGEVIGVSALEYIQMENLPDLETKEIDWSKVLSSNAELQEKKLAIIEDEHFELALCYEALVTAKHDSNHTYRMFVDANSGKIQKIELHH